MDFKLGGCINIPRLFAYIGEPFPKIGYLFAKPSQLFSVRFGIVIGCFSDRLLGSFDLDVCQILAKLRWTGEAFCFGSRHGCPSLVADVDKRRMPQKDA
ncbi:hypothetical protein ASC90_19830 [Rhizobium sp. Root1220]|nr:hypothetical protein ASC90_19830 [Rhizobium sp. Root1220]